MDWECTIPGQPTPKPITTTTPSTITKTVSFTGSLITLRHILTSAHTFFLANHVGRFNPTLPTPNLWAKYVIGYTTSEKLLFGFYVLLPGLLPADFEGTIVYGVTQTSIFDGYPRDSLGNAFFDIHDVRVHPRYQGDWCCNC